MKNHGQKKPNYQPPTDVRSKITILAEGPRGHLTKSLTEKLNLQEGRNPQIYSTGIKELWEVPAGSFPEGRVIHTMGFPLSNEEFGGGFIYGLKDNKVALGFVVGLDYLDPTFDPHHAFQIYKQHPFIHKIIENGRMLRYGAKTVPEGGLFSMPKLHHDGLMIVGDSASFLNMPALKGIHLAIKSGMLAAQSAFEALLAKDFSSQQLSLYDTLFKKSWAHKELWRERNFRQGFHNNTFLGLLRYGFQMITGGRGFSLSGKLKVKEDGELYKTLAKVRGKSFQERFKNQLHFDKKYTFDKLTDVYFSGTHHEEDQPVHLVVPDHNLCVETCVPMFGAPCQRFCPAEVYEMAQDAKTGQNHLVIHAENCVHCKTCDVKDPLRNINWVTPYGGDGPDYKDL
jgi:electron-transferring-flavoprotein dehydrogenase